MTSTDMIDEETDPIFLRRKAQEYGHTMTEWEEAAEWQYPCDPDPGWEMRTFCQDCGLSIETVTVLDKITDGNGKFVGFEDRTEISGDAHTTPCATYHLHTGTLFPFLPRPNRRKIYKTKGERTQK